MTEAIHTGQPDQMRNPPLALAQRFIAIELLPGISNGSITNLNQIQLLINAFENKKSDSAITLKIDDVCAAAYRSELELFGKITAASTTEEITRAATVRRACNLLMGEIPTTPSTYD